MGCDIHAWAEKRNGDDWVDVDVGEEPFNWRNYGTFAFLAGIRNYSGIKPISEPRGLPATMSSRAYEDYRTWDSDAHSASYLSVDELAAFNYDAEMEDRRYTKQVGPNSFDGGATCEPGNGIKQTWREFLGPAFFETIERLKAHGAERVVFWFDN